LRIPIHNPYYKSIKMKKHSIFIKTLFLIAVILITAQCKKAPVADKVNISYEKYQMPNGLQVILSTDNSDPVISYAIMYHVGSSMEVPVKTGFAHLF